MDVAKTKMFPPANQLNLTLQHKASQQVTLFEITERGECVLALPACVFMDVTVC